ncbi:MAG: hypothetical protein ACKO15_00355, partial [Burkholderiales bacterium]
PDIMLIFTALNGKNFKFVGKILTHECEFPMTLRWRSAWKSTKCPFSEKNAQAVSGPGESVEGGSTRGLASDWNF